LGNNHHYFVKSIIFFFSFIRTLFYLLHKNSAKTKKLFFSINISQSQTWNVAVSYVSFSKGFFIQTTLYNFYKSQHSGTKL